MGEADPRILVGIDGSKHSVDALEWALDEAVQRGATVEAVFVWQVPTLAYSAPGYIPIGEPEVARQGQACLDEALSHLEAPPGVRLEQTAVEGSPAEVLANLAQAPHVTEVVVGAQGHGGVAGLILGSVSHALTHHCPKPLVIIPGGDGAEPARAARPIVVGVDGSPGAERALVWGVAAARARRVPLEAVMVLPLSAHAAHSTTTTADDDPEALAALREFVTKVDTSGVEVRTVVLAGPPARVLTERSALGQMLVLGTRGHGWAREAITGSVSHSCTHKALAPTVVVPQDR